jgi:hypothetical protein
MWEERSANYEEGAQWRFQLEDPHTGRRYGFNDLPGLVAYLQEVAYDGDSGSVSALPGQDAAIGPAGEGATSPFRMG